MNAKLCNYANFLTKNPKNTLRAVSLRFSCKKVCSLDDKNNMHVDTIHGIYNNVKRSLIIFGNYKPEPFRMMMQNWH